MNPFVDEGRPYGPPFGASSSSSYRAATVAQASGPSLPTPPGSIGPSYALPSPVGGPFEDPFEERAAYGPGHSYAPVFAGSSGPPCPPGYPCPPTYPCPPGGPAVGNDCLPMNPCPPPNLCPNGVVEEGAYVPPPEYVQPVPRYFGLMDLLDWDLPIMHNDDQRNGSHLISKWSYTNFMLFAGFQGFKGPADENAGSNFGFHEGFNWSVPIVERWGLSHQTGMQGVHSDLSGGSGLNAARNQFFITSGFYVRPLCGRGLQYGLCADYLHDDWYSKTDLDQVRGEISMVGAVSELGLMGMFHTNVASKTSPVTGNAITWQAYDQYLAYYRRRVHGIGHGRLWGGLNNDGDVILGGDGISPLSTHWAFQSNFNFIFPKGEAFNDAISHNYWTLSFNLVYFPGYHTPNSSLNPFRPLFDVADNTLFLINQMGK